MPDFQRLFSPSDIKKKKTNKRTPVISGFVISRMTSELCATGCTVSRRSSDQKDLFLYSPEIMRLYNVINEACGSGWSTKFLVLLRGLPGSGKSTLARFLTRKLDHHNFLIASNDDYFYDGIEKAYKYDDRMLCDAIAACKLRVWSSMLCGLLVIIVDNCNLTLAEIDPFIREGVKRNYSIHLLEPNTPWRYNTKKLLKLTHHTNLNLTELNRMLTLFQQKLNLATILSEFSLKSSSPLTPVLLQNENFFNQNHTVTTVTSSTSVGNNSNNLSEHVCYHSNNNVGNDNEKRDDTNLAQSSNIKTTTNSNDSSDNNNATNTSNTTGNFDGLVHHDEIWGTPTGSMENLDINYAASSEPNLQDSSHCETTTNTLTTSPLPQPSTSGGKLSELMSIFPNLGTNLLEEFLTLAYDDVSWATTLILDNHTCERFGQQIEHDSDPVENACTFSSANQTFSNPPTTITYTPNCCSNTSNDSRIDTDQNVISLVKESQDMNETTFTINHQCGIRLSRHFLQAAYEEYAFSLGLSDLDMSPEVIPDFIINEWSPEPNLTKEIFISFLRYLGVFSSVATNMLTPKFPSLNVRNSNQISKKSSITSERSTSSKFLQIMHDEEGLFRSVEDFRTSLSTPVVRLILNRLMSKFPGTQKNVIEEAFVRCEFEEARTEVYLLTYYKSSCESIMKSSVINSTAPTTTVVTSDSSFSQFYNKNTSSTMNQQSVYSSTVMPNYPVGLDCRITEGNLSLREIQDEEEALNRSIEDQRDRLLTLGNQLCLSRLKAQFPGIEINYLENLFIQFDLNEQNLLDYLTKHGFTPQPLNPFLVDTTNRFVENIDTNNDVGNSSILSKNYLNATDRPNTVHNTDWLNVINEKINNIRQKITHTKNSLSYTKDNRAKPSRISEIRSLQSQLHYLELQKAEYLVDTRSALYEDELLTNNSGERPINAACLAFAYLDLHGISKSCALYVLQQRLTYLRDKLNSPKYFTVITGRAAGSESDLVSMSPVLRPAVIQYLIRNGYKFEENYRIGSGHFTVNLNNRRWK
ncbi:hypothetical protein MN116_004989 [Schistosoma mekongi]|uniref:Smr domain-containing protein n=1 Tax=Schistosoma mekongi TaxID=38744 RepID=A0AAE1ZD27_SCHME|nr:hypothetical protein MN116_004989 [Schistosoma mekongi]